MRKFFPWISGLVWLLLRWGLYITIGETSPDQARSIGVMINLFFIILIIFSVLMDVYRERRTGMTTTFITDLKRVLKETMKYSIAVGIMIAVFYHFVSNELELKREADYKAAALALDTDEEVAAVKKENPQLKDLSREEILDAVYARTDLFTNKKIISSASFLVTVFVSLLYSLFSVLLFRYFLRFRSPDGIQPPSR